MSHPARAALPSANACLLISSGVSWEFIYVNFFRFTALVSGRQSQILLAQSVSDRIAHW